jgi:hypothetical protein
MELSALQNMPSPVPVTSMLELYSVPQIKQASAHVIFQLDGAPPFWGLIVHKFLDRTFPESGLEEPGLLYGIQHLPTEPPGVCHKGHIYTRFEGTHTLFCGRNPTANVMLSRHTNTG